MTMRDLIVLTANLDMENAIKGLLSRHQSLAIRRITTRILRHPERDPGCAVRGVDFLTRYADQYHHGLLIFDHEGSGREGTDRQELQGMLNTNLAHSSWNHRARAIVVDPELETWVWSDSPEVDLVLGWRNQPIPLRVWLSNENWVRDDSVKPMRP